MTRGYFTVQRLLLIFALIVFLASAACAWGIAVDTSVQDAVGLLAVGLAAWALGQLVP